MLLVFPRAAPHINLDVGSSVMAVPLQDASQISQWQVPTNTIVQVGRLLKPGEDEIAQVGPQPVSLNNVNLAVINAWMQHAEAR